MPDSYKPPMPGDNAGLPDVTLTSDEAVEAYLAQLVAQFKQFMEMNARFMAGGQQQWAAVMSHIETIHSSLKAQDIYSSIAGPRALPAASNVAAPSRAFSVSTQGSAVAGYTTQPLTASDVDRYVGQVIDSSSSRTQMPQENPRTVPMGPSNALMPYLAGPALGYMGMPGLNGYLPYGGGYGPYTGGAGFGSSTRAYPNGGSKVWHGPSQGLPAGGGMAGYGGGGGYPTTPGGGSHMPTPSGGGGQFGGGAVGGGGGGHHGGGLGALGGAASMFPGALGAIGRAVPYIGAAVVAGDVIKHGYATYMEQREKNYQYQHVEGGSNFQAFNDRAAEESFKLHHLGQAGSTEAFKDATGLGYRGSSRNQVAGAAVHLRSNYGIGVNESMQTFSEATKNVSTNIQEVVSGLEQVTKAARTFGVNAVEVRKKLNDSFSLATDAGAGASALPLATATTSAVTSLGKQFQDVTYNKIFDKTSQMLIAGQSGQSFGQLQNEIMNNPTGYLQTAGNYQVNAIQQALGSDGVAAAQQIIQKYSGATNDSTRAAAGLEMQQWLNSNGKILTIVQVLNTLGLSDVDQNNVGATIIAELANASGGGVLGTAAKNAPATGGNYKISSSGQLVNSQGQQVSGQSYSKNGFIDNKKFNNDVTQKFGNSLKDTTTTNATKTYAQDISGQGYGFKTDTNQNYLKGQRNNVLEALMQNLSGNTKVSVNTAGGGQKTMTLAEAIRYYPAEVAAGQAQVVSGKHAGSYTNDASLTGGLSDKTSSTLNEAAKESTSQSLSQGVSKHANGVQDTDNYLKKHPLKGSQSTNSVQVDLTPEAKKILRVVSNDTSAQSGFPSAINHYGSPS